MFRWIIGSSPRFRFLITGFSAALLIFGHDVTRPMPVDVFPEFAPPRVDPDRMRAHGITFDEVLGSGDCTSWDTTDRGFRQGRPRSNEACFRGLARFKYEGSALDPTASEFKHHAPGIGFVRDADLVPARFGRT
jgi:hypothetical protein